MTILLQYLFIYSVYFYKCTLSITLLGTFNYSVNCFYKYNTYSH